MIHVDAVFVISLARRPDRLEAFRSRLPADWPLPPPAVVSAVDGELEERPRWWQSTAGAWGCYRSHREVIASAVDAGLERVLILEDDVTFAPDFTASATALEVPTDAQVLYLGGQHLARPEPGPPGLLVGRNVNRTHAYAVLGRPALLVLLEHLRPDQALWKARHHVDHHYGILHRDRAVRVYACQPWLCGQASGKSDVGKSSNTDRWWRR